MRTPRPMTHKRQPVARDILVGPGKSAIVTLRDLEAGGLPTLPVKIRLLKWHGVPRSGMVGYFPLKSLWYLSNFVPRFQLTQHNKLNFKNIRL